MADGRRLHDFNKRRIASALPLRKGVSLAHVMAEIESATQRFWQDADGESKYQDVSVDGDTLHFTLKRHTGKASLKTGRIVSGGAPPKKALRAYLTSLVTLYERVTGKRITRIVNPYAPAQAEKRNAYLVACMKAAGKTYPAGLVRQVLEQSKHTKP